MVQGIAQLALDLLRFDPDNAGAGTEHHKVSRADLSFTFDRLPPCANDALGSVANDRSPDFFGNGKSDAVAVFLLGVCEHESFGCKIAQNEDRHCLTDKAVSLMKCFLIQMIFANSCKFHCCTLPDFGWLLSQTARVVITKNPDGTETNG